MRGLSRGARFATDGRCVARCCQTQSWFDMAMLPLLLIGGQANKNFGAKSLSDWTLLTGTAFWTSEMTDCPSESVDHPEGYSVCGTLIDSAKKSAATTLVTTLFDSCFDSERMLKYKKSLNNQPLATIHWRNRRDSNPRRVLPLARFPGV